MQKSEESEFRQKFSESRWEPKTWHNTSQRQPQHCGCNNQEMYTPGLRHTDNFIPLQSKDILTIHRYTKSEPSSGWRHYRENDTIKVCSADDHQGRRQRSETTVLPQTLRNPFPRLSEETAASIDRTSLKYQYN